jgi:hypothetical protein
VLLEESVVTRLPHASSGTALVGARARSGALVLVLACTVLAALTLLVPSAPTYDPWSWIIWGREIAHLDLVTTEGPSWKPLPVLFTTVFSFFGSAAPDLWLVVARAGAFAGIVLAFRVSRRLGGGLVGGAAAGAALAIAPWWVRNAAMGNSEGLLVALMLGAVDRHLAGDRRAAFLLAAAAALLRPEVWPFLGLYGLRLLWRGGVARSLIVVAGAAVVALWLVPEWFGSGDLFRAAHRAKDVNPGAPTYADNPAVEVLRNAAAMLTAPTFAGLVAGVGLLVARRDRALAVLAGLAIAWLGLVAYMTQDGFSGNQRYLIAPAALLIVLGGAAAGRLLRWGGARLTNRPVRRGLVRAAVAVVAVAFAAPSFAQLLPTMREVHYQADLVNELPGLVRGAGGADALRRCGDAYTGPFLVPAVAWNLHVHTQQVQLEPLTPAVVFRVKMIAGASAAPSLDAVAPGKTLAVGKKWRIVAVCGAPAA